MSFIPVLLPLAQAGEILDLFQPGPRLYLLLGVYGGLLALGLLAGALVLANLARHPPDWNARIQDVMARPVSVRFGLAYTAAVMGLWVAGASLAMLARRWVPDGMDEAAGSLIHGLFFQVIGLLALACYLRVRAKSWGRMFGAGPDPILRQVGRAAILYLAAMPAVIAVGLVFHLLLWWFGHPAKLQNVVYLFQQGLPAPVLAMAPVFEETLFRGIGLSVLTRRLGLAPAIALTSLLFAAAHLHLPSLPQLFVLAVAFCLAYVATGSLLTPIVMHALFNGVSLGLLWLATAE
jgi:membrane protease YdiL (CAAX protease family)